MGSFSRFSTIFFRIFYNFFGIFYNFFGKFLQFFGKFLQFFCDFSENFSENSRTQSVTVQPGSRHYCKFTIKFTSKFTPILIKILQSTKFEGSHFLNSLQPFPLFVLFPLRRRVFSTIALPCQRYQRPSLPLRRRRYVGNTRDYK